MSSGPRRRYVNSGKKLAPELQPITCMVSDGKGGSTERTTQAASCCGVDSSYVCTGENRVMLLLALSQ